MTPPTILRCCETAFTNYNVRGTQGETQTHAANNSSIVVCIRYRGNLFTKPLPSNGKGIHFTELLLATIGWTHRQTHRLMGGIYQVRRSDALRCYEVHTKFHKNWFRHSKVDGGGGFRDTHTHTA
jgi:hypothetical protein